MTPTPSPPRHAPSPYARVGWAVLLGHRVLCPLLLTTHTVEAFEENKTALLTATALVLLTLGLSALGGKVASLPSGKLLLSLGLRGLRCQPITCGFLLFAASAVVSTVFSLSPHTSWRGGADSHAGLKTILGYLALFVATRLLCRHVRDGRRLVAGAVVAGAVTAAYALVQFAHCDPIGWASLAIYAGHPRPFGTLGHANHLGAYLAMTLPFAVAAAGRAWRRRQWVGFAVLAAGGALAVPVVFITLSRGAWLATAAVALVLAVTWRRRAPRRTGRALRVAGLALLALVGVAVALGTHDRAFRSSLTQRLRHVTSASGRWQIWQASWGLFCDRPLTGCGPDAFRLAFGSRRPPEFGRLEWDVTPTRAHNVLLHALATQGLPGAAAVLLLAAALVRAGVRAWRRARPVDRPFLAALLASLTAFGVQALFNFTVAGCGTLFVTCAALVSRWGESPDPAPTTAPASGRSWPLVLVAGGALALLSLASSAGFAGGRVWLGLAGVGALTTFALARTESGRPARPHRHVLPAAPPAEGRAGRVLAHLGCAAAGAALLWVEVGWPIRASVACRQGDLLLHRDTDAARACYERALALDSGSDRFWTRLSGAEQLLARQAVTADGQRRAWRRAGIALERAFALVPADPFHRANRARLLGELAWRGLAPADEARAEWDAVLTADPCNATFLGEAARSALALGEHERCRRLAVRGLALYPTFGLLHANLGASAFAEGRAADALPHLERAVRADWYGDEEGLARATAILNAAHRALTSR